MKGQGKIGRLGRSLLLLSQMIDFSRILYQIAQSLPGFLLAIVAHEWAHAYMALKFGDDTAKRAGRVSFNPAVHYDLMGTIIFPILGIITGWGFIGWAKPVPVNLRNVDPKKIDKANFWISFAGPIANFVLAIFSSLLVVCAVLYFPSDSAYYPHLVGAIKYSLFINLILGVFNLIPFPPLDGSHMLGSFLNYEQRRKYFALSAYTNYVFMALFALSMMGVNIYGYILGPFLGLGSYMTLFFFRLMGAA